MFYIVALATAVFASYYLIQHTEMNDSVEYNGIVRHIRVFPYINRFEYVIKMDYFNLDNPPIGYILNHDKSKYLFHNTSHINYMLNKNTYINKNDNRCNHVKLLTNLNYFGICFNPISVYFCYDVNDNLRYIISEVTNIPWFEKTFYVSSTKDKKNTMFRKKMHVSPFNHIKRQKYLFDYRITDDTIYFQVDVHENRRMIIQANMMLYKNANVNKIRSFRSIQTMFYIHIEAFKLWVKGMPLYNWEPKIE